MLRLLARRLGARVCVIELKLCAEGELHQRCVGDARDEVRLLAPDLQPHPAQNVLELVDLESVELGGADGGAVGVMVGRKLDTQACGWGWYLQ